MTIEVGTILEMTVLSNYGTSLEDFRNQFHYRVVATNENPSLANAGNELMLEFMEQLAAVILPVTGVGYRYSGYVIQNLDDPNDFSQGSFPSAFEGTVVGDNMPPFLAWGFKLNRTTRVTRNGAKRFGGVNESQVFGNTPTAPALALLNDISPLLSSDLTLTIPAPSTLVTEIEPVIVRKTGQFTYTFVNLVASANFNAVTTQNSRKQRAAF